VRRSGSAAHGSQLLRPSLVRVPVSAVRLVVSALYIRIQCLGLNVLTASVLSNNYPRTDRDTLVKVGDIIINKAKAARRNGLAYSLRCIGAVNPVDRSTEVHGTSAHRIAGPASHKPRQIRLPLNHLGRRMPIRPLSLARYLQKPLPSEALAANAYAVASG